MIQGVGEKNEKAERERKITWVYKTERVLLQISDVKGKQLLLEREGGIVQFKVRGFTLQMSICLVE